MRATLLLSILLLVPTIAPAEVLSRGQVACALALQSSGARVARVATAQMLACLDDAARGGQSLEACRDADPKGRLAKAKAKTEAAARKHCEQPPPFGFTNAGVVNDALSGVLRTDALLGPGLVVATDHDGARCQRAVARAFARAALARLGAGRGCLTRVLRKQAAPDVATLQACLAAGKPHAVGAHAIARACRNVPPADAVPGSCGRGDLDAVMSCTAAEARCGACLALAAGGTLGTGCDAITGITPATACRPKPTNLRSVARRWDEAILAAIRVDLPRPPVHARNLFHTSVAMWDAWAAYDGVAAQVMHHERRTGPAADRDMTISYAAYRVIRHRYANSANASTTRAALDETMRALGYDPDYDTTTGDGAAALGNRIAETVITSTLNDGSNEAGNYADPTYTPINAPLVVKDPGTTMIDPNHWQPLALDSQIGQNGVPIPGMIQTYVGPQWGSVTPFALTRALPTDAYLDPGEPPRLGGDGDAVFKERILGVLRMASQLTIDDGAMIDISPAAWGNNPLGTNDGTGYPFNPVLGEPYLPQVVKRGDFARVLAEFWADGPMSETPPGHWNTIANTATDSPSMVQRIGGEGAPVGDLEWDVKLYLALNAAVHDAAVQCWGVKRRYDGVRPISMVRWMGGLGQSSEPLGPSYNALGLPLEPGLVEVVTPESSAPGQRHEALAAHVGEIAVLSWPGQPSDPRTQYSGVRWVRAVEWLPYQRSTFVTPAFPGFTSGHSTFSRSAAELLTRFTGSSFFPGGMGGYVVPAGFLQFEVGPSTDVHLEWAQYYDAADQAGLSRLFGGIHTAEDDFHGRIAGAQIGALTWEKARTYFAGTP